MKKYTLENYKEFCDKALDIPPMDEFDEGIIDEDKWYEDNKVRIIKGEHEIVLDYTADVANEIAYVLNELYEEEFGDVAPVVFKTKLTEAFKSHMFMKDRDRHTINELLYVLEHDSRFDGEDFNISIRNLGGYWTCIPCLDTFVTSQVREMWFEDAKIEFEVEECGEERFNCITIYEIQKG